MTQIDTDNLVKRLEARYGIGLTGGEQEVDGGFFISIRPNDLERPNGFSIIVARTPKIVEASLRLDGFTRSLLRIMSECEDYQRSIFASLASQSKANGFRISVSINDNYIEDVSELPRGEWTKLEIDCDNRLPNGKISVTDLNSAALEIVSSCLGLVLSLLPIEDVTDSVLGFEPGLPEGAKIRVEVNRYERSPVNRAACIAHYGTKCIACGLDFSEMYGSLGSDYIEVHHRIPVSDMGASYRLNPVEDLITVCANCHAMLHRAKPPLSVDVLSDIINNQRTLLKNVIKT